MKWAPMDSIISIVEKIDFISKRVQIMVSTFEKYAWFCLPYMITWNKREEEEIREVSYKNKEECLLLKSTI